MNARSSGYSGTPLAKKLGIKEGSCIYLSGAPGIYTQLFDALPDSVQFHKKVAQTTDIVHVFATKSEDLKQQLKSLRHQLRADAAVWISWPKKSAKIPSDINENVIREIALPMGYVDIKVCAVNEIWSGLKLVIRKQFRE